MIDHAQFEKLLGISPPWKVEEVSVDCHAKRVLVRVACGKTTWASPKGVLHVHGWETRRWRHLDLWQCQTIIQAEVPRVKDPRTGLTETVVVPWAEPLSRWTREFESRAVDVLLATRTVSDAAALLGLGWRACDVLMKRAVARGMERRGLLEVSRVGIDEKSFKHGQDYISLMTDLCGRRVLEVVEGADKMAVVKLWETLEPEQRGKVEAAAMDRGAAMIAGTEAAAPKVVIVHDKFHISQDQNKAVDAVRRAENNRLLEEGDETLKGTRWMWLKGLEKQSEKCFQSFEQLVRLNLKTARAWELKSTFEGFWEQPDAARGKAFFEKWYGRAVRSRMPEFVKLAKSLSASLPRLLNYFRYRITNAMSEGFNSVVQQLKAAARGFRSFASYRARILFYCGGLELKPSTKSHGIG